MTTHPGNFSAFAIEWFRVAIYDRASGAIRKSDPGPARSASTSAQAPTRQETERHELPGTHTLYRR